MRPCLALVVTIGAALSCRSGTEPDRLSRPVTVNAMSATNLVGRVRTAVTEPPYVQVLSGTDWASGMLVEFRILSGGGQVADTIDVTNRTGGSTSGDWILGDVVGEQRLGVFIDDSLYLTFVATAVSEPTLPPIVFSAPGTSQHHHIYSVASMGQERVQLTSGPGDDRSPTLSPDGDRIAFLRDGRFHFMNIDGSNVVGMNQPQDMMPAGRFSWSPDGNRFVFSDRATWGLSVVNIDGSEPAPLSVPPPAPLLCANCRAFLDYTPDWSPDGQRIVFTRDEDLEFSVLWMMNSDGSDAKRVGRLEQRITGFAVWSAWSPVWAADGGIAFAGPNNAHIGTIFAMNRDPFAVRELARSPYPPDCSPSDWSGDWVLLTCALIGGTSDVRLVDTRIGLISVLFTGESPAFINAPAVQASGARGRSLAGVAGPRTRAP